MKSTLASLAIAILGIKSATAFAIYHQCGEGNTGSTVCDAGLTYVNQNTDSSQCLPSSSSITTTKTTKTTKDTTTRTTASSGSTPSPTGHFTNPIKSSKGADPFMVYDGGYYYLLTTSSDLQITRATTIAGLKIAHPKVVWTKDSVADRCCNYWAPEVHKIGSTWYLYYSAGPAGTTEGQHVHVLAGGSTPYDKYTYKAQLAPKNAPDDWAIDGTVLTIRGTNYFVFSGVHPTAEQSLYIAPSTNAYTAGARSLISEPTNSWERHGGPGRRAVNEGPQPLYHNGATYLSYSASHCSTPNYSLGLLKYNGGDPTSISSWTKSGPYLTSANGNYGPGHNGFFTTPGGITYIVFHATANSTGNCGDSRYTMIQPMSWQSDGVTPIFPVPAPLSQSIPEYP